MLCASGVLNGCGSKPRTQNWSVEQSAIASKHVDDAAAADRGRERTRLSPAEQRKILATLRDIPKTEGYESTGPPRPAELGMRWSDVPRAASAACAEIEAAVFHITRRDDEYVFEIRTIDDRPGRMIVIRTSDERVYELQVRIGLFEGDAALEDDLREAFEKKMKVFGRKRQFPEE